MTDERLSRLSRPDASAAADAAGWRYLLGALCARVDVGSLDEAIAVAGAAAAAADGTEHLRIDVRPDRVELVLQTPSVAAVTARDAELARAITDRLASSGVTLSAGTDDRGRSAQMLEIAIDAIDIAAIRPFWMAVMGYGPEPGDEGPAGALIDPHRQGPSIWFQQMDAERPQRNRIHFDITVPHDEAPARIAAALAAGGSMVNDESARAFWILADAEGNEICVCTWQDRG